VNIIADILETRNHQCATLSDRIREVNTHPNANRLITQLRQASTNILIQPEVATLLHNALVRTVINLWLHVSQYVQTARRTHGATWSDIRSEQTQAITYLLSWKASLNNVPDGMSYAPCFRPHSGSRVDVATGRRDGTPAAASLSSQHTTWWPRCPSNYMLIRNRVNRRSSITT
jgi:hypothetical protein